MTEIMTPTVAGDRVTTPRGVPHAGLPPSGGGD
jgi:hypothetical protein